VRHWRIIARFSPSPLAILQTDSGPLNRGDVAAAAGAVIHRSFPTPPCAGPTINSFPASYSFAGTQTKSLPAPSPLRGALGRGFLNRSAQSSQRTFKGVRQFSAISCFYCIPSADAAPGGFRAIRFRNRAARRKMERPPSQRIAAAGDSHRYTFCEMLQRALVKCELPREQPPSPTLPAAGEGAG
jgi:hypothetical protein